MNIRDVNDLLRLRSRSWYRKWCLASGVQRKVYWALYIECRTMPDRINVAKRALDKGSAGLHPTTGQGMPAGEVK